MSFLRMFLICLLNLVMTSKPFWDLGMFLVLRHGMLTKKQAL